MTGPRTNHATVQVLGRVAVAGPAGVVEVTARQPASVLAHLALEPRGATRDELADVLWGAAVSGHWQGALRGVLSKVRRAMVDAGFAADVVRSDDTVVRLDLEVHTDLGAIEVLVEDATATPELLADAEHALARPFLPHDDSEWGRRTRARIFELGRRVVVRRATALVERGSIDQAITALRRAVADDPLDEQASHLLIEALVADGRRVAASDVFDELTTRLALELGVAPSPATAGLFDHAATASRFATPSSLPVAPSGHRKWSSIHPHTDDPFVGRARELELLHAIWSDVDRSRRPQLVVIEGPAGMGKTRLVDRFCVGLRRDELVDHVVWGRDRGTVARAYGALGEAVARLLAEEPAIAAHLGDRLDGLAPLLPARVAHDHPEAPRADHHGGDSVARAGLTAALRTLLETLAERPTVWFADDLQWATSDAIATLEEAIDGLSGRLLVLIASRDLSRDAAAALAALQRVVPTTSIRLDGLSIADVAGLFTDHDVARGVQRRTGGLPFYASELARTARLAGGTLDPRSVPDAIADWVSARTQSLATDAALTLTLASVIDDDDIDIDLLERCSSNDTSTLARIVDQFVATGLLTSTAESAGAPRLQFSHRITRDAVYDQIGPTTRSVLHRHVADTLARVSGSIEDAEPDHAALSHHYSLAGPPARSLAWRHALQAGRAAMRAGAWVAAERQFERAAGCSTGARTRGHALVGRGRALHAQERFDEARASLHEALAIARTDDLAIVTASATLALVGRAGRGASLAPDAAHVELLREALSVIERADAEHEADAIAATATTDELRCALERELALSLLLTDAAEERTRLLRRSLDRARALRPVRHETLANAVLGSRYAQLGAADLEARLGDIDEVLAMPARAVGDDVRLAAYCYRHEDLLRSGRFADADTALDHAEHLVSRFPNPYWTWAVRTWRALTHVRGGDLVAAEAAAVAAAGTRPQVAEAAACLAVNLVDIRLYQGRAREMIPALAAATVAHPRIPTYRAVLALCMSEAGDLERAGDELRWFRDASFENLPDDTNRFLGLGVLAHVAANVGDEAAGDLLSDLLMPYEHQWVVLQCYGGGGAMWGPVAHGLARVAALNGRFDQAEHFYDRAAALAAGAPLVMRRVATDRVADRLADRRSSG